MLQCHLGHNVAYLLTNMITLYPLFADLTGLAMPALVSILQAPLVLFLYPTLTKLMWPTLENPPNVNDAIACFLMPAGER